MGKKYKDIMTQLHRCGVCKNRNNLFICFTFYMVFYLFVLLSSYVTFYVTLFVCFVHDK